MTTFVGSASSEALASNVAAQTEHAIELNWTWPSTTPNDLIVWCLAYSIIGGQIVDVPPGSIGGSGSGCTAISYDGADWSLGSLWDSVMFQNGTRDYYGRGAICSTVDQPATFMHIGIFRIEAAMDLASNPDLFLAFDVHPYTDYTVGVAAAFACAAYTGWTSANYLARLFEFDPVAAVITAPTYPATDNADLTARWCCWLEDPGTPNRAEWDEGTVGDPNYIPPGGDALNPVGTWDVREYEYNPGPVEGQTPALETTLCLLPGVTIQDKSGISDSGEVWDGNRSVLMAQVVFDDPTPPDPPDPSVPEPGAAFLPVGTTFDLASATQPGGNRYGLDVPLYPYRVSR